MGIYVVQTKGINILDRYELTHYANDASGIRYRFFDTKEQKEIELVDNGGDGLDAAAIDEKPVSGEAATSPEFTALFEAARREVALKIPAYLKEFQDMYRPEVIGKKTLDVTKEIHTSPQGGKREDFFFRVGDEKRYFMMEGVEKGDAGFKTILLSIVDRESGFSFSLQINESDPIVNGAVQYLGPLVQLISASPVKFNGRISGDWPQFLRSKEFDALDGQTGEAGGPSETDSEMARIFLMGADRYSQTAYARLPQMAQSLLARYKGEKTPEALRAFLKAEEKAASALTELIEKASPRLKMALNDDSLKEFYIDIFGGLNWNLVDRNSEKPEYIFVAIDHLLQQYSNGRFKLRERTLQYLNRTLSVQPGKKLVFTDSGQNNGESFEFPPVAVLNLIYGGFNPYGPGVSVDGYFFHDVDSDGKIHAGKDKITEKWFGFGVRLFDVTSYDKMMKNLGAKYPPPFDPSKFATTGVPLSDIRKWSEMVANEFIKKRHISANPLEDGAYRVFIYRAEKGGIDPDGFWLSAFVALNDFDDVYVVPPTWGLEAALNEAAARGIPIDEIYIGSHSDIFEFGDIVLDYDRHLKFAKGARVYFTGCYTDPYMAELMGAQIFSDSSGIFQFADGFNIPTPFGGMLTSGEYYTARFDHGRMTDISHHPLVDPIPGGLF